jgi:hypothetical protein
LILTAAGGDHFHVLKDNQPTLHRIARETLDGRAADRVSQTQCEHGRVEWRELRVAAFDLDIALFPGARQLASLTRWYCEKKSSAGFKSETRHFITSLSAILALIPPDEHASLNQAFLHYADHRSAAIRLLTQTQPYSP